MPPRVEALRSQEGPFDSDDDLLLAAFYQKSQLEPLFAVRGQERVTMPESDSLKTALDLLATLPKERGVYAVSHAGLDIECMR